MTPILLLDEVAAHLDPGRRRALFDKLAALGCQSFVTGADIQLFERLPASSQVFRVAEGRLTLAGGKAG
jgi:DNA replication and repair protein RecF